MNEYTQQAENFASKWGVTLKIKGSEYKPMFGEKSSCYVFKCVLKRNHKQYTFDFWQSIYNGSKEPELYDILAAMTKYDPTSFEDFCGDYGYDQDSRQAYKTYLAVEREYAAMERLFYDDEQCWVDFQEIN